MDSSGNSINTITGDESVCVRRILSINDMDHWFKSKGYKDVTAFIRQLNDFAKGAHNHLSDRSTIKTPCLLGVLQLLDNLTNLVDDIKPIQGDKNQRFGNKAFRLWCEEMRKKCSFLFEENFDPTLKGELLPYLQESFGNQLRIDYGTGHELSFIIFLMGIYKLVICVDNIKLPMDKAKQVSHEFLTLFTVNYMPLCRKVQLAYQLEPAGSHGVYSLDDFQFLPFLFGSSQLIAHPTLEPKNFPDPQIAEDNSSKFMFFAAIHFIHQVKKGPFPEHSNQLWNISGVENWTKINRGLLKMYTDEVLNKFPIVQHLVFGPNILIWDLAS
ncbi:serine/threonine-protein phosphatase 2A activator-like [Panonychus citri]|uniref:serine/threonine-protein phosphatase 2A activator-like n=1 Tax=Panonychus citri TaxID=50023 RepID=UPI002306F6AC|nr:serine/threonine-protein phosphatase 2A activator-like [Panonychus citri]